MAAITLYLAVPLVNFWARLTETAQSAGTTASGWVVSTGSANHSELESGVERAASTFVGTGPPDGSLDTSLHDAFRSENPYTGTFANSNWEFHGVVRAVTNGGAQDGRVRFRLFKADSDGSNATEITSAQQQGALVSNVSTSADFDSNLTFNPGSFSINNQYLFFQIAWERTGAGGMTNSDIAFRTGSSSSAGTRVITADLASAYALTADAGAHTLTGTAATLKVGYRLTADAGAYTLTGTAATLRRGFPLAAGAGSYTMSGTASGMTATRLVGASGGAYTISGTAATLRRGFPLAANAGAYTMTGASADLTATRLVGASGGAYSMTGTAAGLFVGFDVAAAAGAYVWTGTAATLTYGGGLQHYTLSAVADALTLLGAGADLVYQPVQETPAGGGGWRQRPRRTSKQTPPPAPPPRRLANIRRLSLPIGAGQFRMSGSDARFRVGRQLTTQQAHFLRALPAVVGLAGGRTRATSRFYGYGPASFESGDGVAVAWGHSETAWTFERCLE